MTFKWVGPFQIKAYSENAISKKKIWDDRWPCERDAVYLVSQHQWTRTPDPRAEVLYIGSNTGRRAGS